MAKDEQKKQESAKANSAPDKMSRKQFEKELAKLQVELVRLQAWVQAQHVSVAIANRRPLA